MTTSDPQAAGPLPAHVTTPLLALITQQSLDEDYQHVAEQRRSGARPAVARTGRSPRTLIAVLLFGTLLAVAAVQTARNAGVTSAGRDQLISRIDSRRAALAGLQAQMARLRTDTGAAQARYDAAGKRLDTLNNARAADLVRTGFDTMNGPGVRVVVNDAPGGLAQGQVQDKDLRLLVNGLWQAGATGISVNGQRITALSALRNSGEVIRINGVSLSPPYTVLAVGDTRTLQAGLAESTSGAQFQAVTDQFGMRVSMENRDDVRLPEASPGMMALHKARSGTSKQQKPPVNQEETQ
ncbi:DUF881 domain-containing protein [Nocardioides panacihumi]|uniref:DUF881 domain-containing protein n=1 Tax=Nocardioides panacihumi TaxID=400774 RepID=A0ABP5D4D3_9ACTN